METGLNLNQSKHACFQHVVKYEAARGEGSFEEKMNDTERCDALEHLQRHLLLAGFNLLV